jgi:hypothetical protein
MKIESSHLEGTFTATCWRTGAAGFTDSDPNSVAPTDAQILTTPSYVFAYSSLPTSFVANGVLMSCFVADGSTASTRFWWFDDVQLIWIPVLNSVSSMTYATTNATNVAVRSVPGCRFFCQVTANSGVTKIAVLLR